jgi:SAM-dependent methyltransferase
MPSRSAPQAARFDADYYARFYGNARTRVSDLAAVRKLAAFVAGYLRYLDVRVRSILDVGCGLGHWRTAAADLWPRARYHGVEQSSHLCERFGWIQASIADFEPEAATGRDTFDLVICQGVLQYLDARAAARALRNLAQWSAGALFLEALTELDWRQNCDRTRTDGNVHLRRGAWYRRRLRDHFLACGGGVFVARRTGVALFELEGG